MSKPFRIYLLSVAGLLIAVLAYHSISHRRGASIKANVPAQPKVVAARTLSTGADKPAAGGWGGTGGVVRLAPNQVLATVNGHEIKLADVLPVGTNGSQRDLEISVQDLKFFLKRAVDRELIFQTAKERGLALNDSQNQQLANMIAMRNQPEPGGIARLNTTEAQRELEMQDAEAFMLQTALMAAQGMSPNVTDNQVLAYYQEHQSQFGDLPVDEAARAQAWAKIDYDIRQELASATRASYNDRLAAYMNQMEFSAHVETTALDPLLTPL